MWNLIILNIFAAILNISAARILCTSNLISVKNIEHWHFFLMKGIFDIKNTKLRYLIIIMEEINHPHYPKSTLEEADAVAWILPSPKAALQKYPFKFHSIQPTEVRLKVLHTSLCQSDVLHGRGHWGNCYLIQDNSNTHAVQGMRFLDKSQ